MPAIPQPLQRIAISMTVAFGILLNYIAHRPHAGITVLLFIVLFGAIIAGVMVQRALASEPHDHPVLQLQAAGNLMNSSHVMHYADEPQSLQAEIKTNMGAASYAASNSQVNAQVEVNGEQIPLPENGNGAVHRESVTNDQTTIVDVSIQSNSTSSGDMSNSSSLHVDVRSNSLGINNSE